MKVLVAAAALLCLWAASGPATAPDDPPGGAPTLRDAVRSAAGRLKPLCTRPGVVAAVNGDARSAEAAYATDLMALFLRAEGLDARTHPASGAAARMAEGRERVKARWFAGLRRAGAGVVVLPVPGEGKDGGPVLRVLLYGVEDGIRLADFELPYRLPEDLAFLAKAERGELSAADKPWLELLECLLPLDPQVGATPAAALVEFEGECFFRLGQWAPAAERLGDAWTGAPDGVLLRLAMALVADGRRAEAEKRVDKAVERKPDSGPAYALKAWLAARGTGPKDAHHFLEQARVSDLSDPRRVSCHLLGRYLVACQLGREQAAEQRLLEAAAIGKEGNPVPARGAELAPLWAARHFWRQAQYERAAEFFRQAIEAGAEGADPWLELGMALEALGQREEAEEALLRAFKIEPGSPHGLADLLWRAGEHEEALRVLERAARLRPDRVDLRMAYGDMAAAMWRVQDAERAFAEVAELDGAFPWAAVRLAAMLRRQRRWDEAAGTLTDLLASRPGHAAALLEMGRLLADKGEGREALETLRQATRSSDYEVAARLAMARLHCAAGRYEQAVDEARMAIAARADAEGFAVLAQGFIGLADWPKAQGAVAKALEASERSPAAWVAAARLARAWGEADEALEHAKRAIDLDPYCAEAVALEARLWVERGPGAHAIALMRRALELNPWDPELHWELAEVLREAGDAEGAIEHYGEHIRLEGGRAEDAARHVAVLSGRAGGD